MTTQTWLVTVAVAASLVSAPSALAQRVRISGSVETAAGTPVPGEPVTDSSGFCAANVDVGWSGTATPTLAGYAFSPPAVTYTHLSADASNQNYVGTKSPAVRLMPAVGQGKVARDEKP